jgi:hypothetical protein
VAVKKIKTVDVTCPSFDSFFQSCDTEDSLPLTKSAARLARIFAEEEVAVSKRALPVTPRCKVGCIGL